MSEAINSPQIKRRQFHPYPKYKDSGVEWLGEIPAHWEVYPLRRRLFQEIGSIKIGPFGSQLKLEFMTQEGFKVFGQEQVIARDFGRGNKHVDKAKFEELAACEIRPNDLVVTMMGSSGRCAVVPEGIERGIMDSHLLRVRLPDCNLDPKFLCLLINDSSYIRDQIETEGKGAIMHGLNSSIIKSILLAVPPHIEQQRILAYLDRETAKIDALIEKKERLIELLQEKRTALITQAVTKGLDLTVPMKNSGAKWLGKIPTHWGVKRLKRLTAMRAGTAITSEDIEAVGDYPVYGGNGIRGYTYSFTHDGKFPLIGRQGALCGCVNFASGKFWASEHAVVTMPGPDLDPYWLTALLQSMSLNEYSQSAAQPGLAVENIGRIPVPVPKLDEQRSISAFLDRETAKIDALMAKIHEAIDRLKEYRTALISAAVTGKIDVRYDFN